MRKPYGNTADADRIAAKNLKESDRIVGLLEHIETPADVQKLAPSQLNALADEIRQLLIQKVSATGGHLGPNLGVVELTLALHYVFDSPNDPIIFDTSHQSYVCLLYTSPSPRD